MSEYKDEVLNGSPKFRIKDDNGNVVYNQATIEMITEILEEGTELNKILFDRLMPSGLIAMWSGSINNIPDGWYLCDGSNGTPNLKNRFIVGAGQTYSIGATGGSNNVTLTQNQIPSHSHTYTKTSVSSSDGNAHPRSSNNCKKYFLIIFFSKYRKHRWWGFT